MAKSRDMDKCALCGAEIKDESGLHYYYLPQAGGACCSQCREEYEQWERDQDAAQQRLER